MIYKMDRIVLWNTWTRMILYNCRDDIYDGAYEQYTLLFLIQHREKVFAALECPEDVKVVTSDKTPITHPDRLMDYRFRYPTGQKRNRACETS